MARIQEHVNKAIETELTYQRNKWGADKQQSLPGFLLIMQKELNEAVDGWMKNAEGRHAPLSEILQVVTTGIACLNYYGVEGSAGSTNDQTEAEMRELRVQASNRRFGVS